MLRLQIVGFGLFEGSWMSSCGRSPSSTQVFGTYFLIGKQLVTI